MTEFVYFIVGVVLTLLLSTPVIERYRTWRSKRSGAAAQQQRDMVQRELAEVEQYHAEPHRLTEFLLVRVLMLNVIWIAAELVDNVLNFIANVQYSVSWTAVVPLNYQSDVVGSILYSISALTGSIILTLLLRLGIRTYRIYRYVKSFETYSAARHAELARLAVVIDRQTSQQLAPAVSPPAQ